jgi:hypothetical protein
MCHPDRQSDRERGYATINNHAGCNEGVDLLPPLCYRKSAGKLVLERSELVKSCLRQNATSFAEGAKKRARHLLSGPLTYEMYRLYEPIKPFHVKQAAIV